MLDELLKKAIDIGADRIEIEYKDGAELVTAFRGQVGVGIAWLDAGQRDQVFIQMRRMKKRKRTTVGDKIYRLTFSEYESFGESVYVLALKVEKTANASLQRTGAKSRASR